ncbi:thiolase family protein [Cellulomonas fimi]|uniref:Probable acetyl-CoA acetyltransferase n=1 Tax=Cellulomonas fimi TaxID=1708 RepID=A0A7Y0QI72_CELFI|nr:thiolase family protein [Cellulomonas fimi]NMR19967.1 thiolase family protein [Cellulomonas fimi]
MAEDRIVLLDGARTPVGSFGGAYRTVEAHELGAIAVRGALARSGVDAGEIGEVVMGCVGQTGPDAYNARRVSLAAGLSTGVPAYTVNRLCGSGLQAVWSAAMQLRTEPELRFVVAGGDENMTRQPFLDFGARGGYALGNRALLDGTIALLTDPFHGIHMGRTAEAVARKYAVNRQEQDEFAAESQRRAALDAARAAFAEEIVPVEVGGRKPFTVDTDEHPRPDTTVETLARLRPVFEEGGTVTAGNASGINDGAAAVVVTRESVARERGLTPLAVLESVTTAALEPEIMGYAPTLAIRKLLDRNGLTPTDVDTVELNEAFAAQALAVIRDAKLDPERTNPYGGAIALGHPIGATGAILTLRTAQDLARRDLELGVVSLCIGGGQALAALLRRWDG